MGPGNLLVAASIAFIRGSQPGCEVCNRPLAILSLVQFVDHVVCVPLGPLRIDSTGGGVVGLGGPDHDAFDCLSLVCVGHRGDATGTRHRPLAVGHGTYAANSSEDGTVPLFMDRHNIPGATAEEVAEAHMSDLNVSAEFDVSFLSYWYDADDGAVFCFAHAPGPEAMTAVHEKSHGLVPAEIIEVSEDDVVRFLGRVNDPTDASELTSPLRTIAFTDLDRSTELLNELGDAAFMVLLTEHDLILRKGLVRFRGREVKHTGDGIMAAFVEARAAQEWAIWVKKRFARRDDMDIRIGLAAGEPVDHNEDLYGPSVNLARRLCDVTTSEHILVASRLRDLTPSDFEYGAPQPLQLKGFAETQTAYELLRAR